MVRFLMILVTALAAASCANANRNQVVTLVTHSSPGGGSDVFLRSMAPHLSRIMQELPVRLTPDEKARKSEQLVKALEDKDGLEHAKKAAVDDFKQRLTAKDYEVKRLTREVSTGIEYREADEALVKNVAVESPRPLYEGRALA
jgi:hypothetical protein